MSLVLELVLIPLTLSECFSEVTPEFQNGICNISPHRQQTMCVDDMKAIHCITCDGILAPSCQHCGCRVHKQFAKGEEYIRDFLTNT